MKIKVTTDSTSDLSEELYQKYNISCLPLYIIKAGESFKDALEITPDDIFAHVQSGGEITSTAAVTVGDYVDCFTPLLEEYDAIVHINLGANYSSCHQNCNIAAQELGGRVFPVDSRSLSLGSGMLAVKAAQLAAQEGMEIPQLLQQLEVYRDEKIRFNFVLETLAYLHKGGRCSSVAALGANLLKLHPCIQVGAKMDVGKKYRGTMKKVWEQWIRDRLAEPEKVDDSVLMIVQTGPDTTDEVQDLIRQCREIVPFKEVYITRAGCTVTSHCGPHTIGLGLAMK